MVSLVKSPGPAVSVGDVFRRAAEVLRERGHCKGDLVDDAGRVCMWGAIQESIQESLGEVDVEGLGYRGEWAVRLAPYAHPMVTAVSRAMDNAALDDRKVFPGADWNDAPEREQTEVEKFLLQVADRADVEGL